MSRSTLVLSAILMAAIFTTGCRSRSVLPDVKEVKVSRDTAPDDCKEIGPINGTTTSAKGTQEQALADLKQEAANKGANYVMIKQYSAYGTSVVGVAYECP
ncbi:MAG: DUF4156 domain-containing protein [Bdellovibrionales bacterium]|nr:DUF4156 domain-containing protein [Bdellovibrionales bacterium]